MRVKIFRAADIDAIEANVNAFIDSGAVSVIDIQASTNFVLTEFDSTGTPINGRFYTTIIVLYQPIIDGLKGDFNCA